MAILPVGISGEADYQISRSLRFNSADSAYLSRTPASAGNRKTWTWSGWVKRGKLNGIYYLFGADVNYIRFNDDVPDNQIRMVLGGGSSLLATPVYRDVSAWYHIVVAVDTTQATASNRVKLYVNGAQVTAFTTETYPTQNTDTPFNNTVAHAIGAYAASPQSYFDGYLTEVNFIDGQALDPSSFGETDPITGVWRPKKYTGTYGTNGFYLNFSDNSGTTSTTLGKDYSGNGNNWTPNNFSVTAGAGNDSLVDVPTRWGSDTGLGGEIRGNYATWLPTYGSTGTFANGNLDITTASGNDKAIPATIFPTSGKWYWEVTVSSNGGSDQYIRIGITNPNGVAQGLGGTANSWCLLGDARVFHNNSASSYGVSVTTSDIVNVALDIDAGKIWYGKNGTWMASGNPATGANPSQTFTAGQSLAPAVASGSASPVYIGNFGSRAFAYTAPSGFKALCTTNLP